MARPLARPALLAAIGRHDRDVLASATQVLALTRARQGPICPHQEELAQLLIELTEHSRGARLDVAWSATFCGFDATGETIRRYVATETAALRAPLSVRLRALADQVARTVRARFKSIGLARLPAALRRTIG